MVRRRPGRPPKYPWPVWFNGEEHTAIKGQDFHYSLEAFRNMVLSKGRGLGITVQTHAEYEPDRLVIRALLEE